MSGKEEHLVLLEFSVQTYATPKYNGLPLAEFDLNNYRLRKCHTAKMVEGVDMALIAAICVCLDKRWEHDDWSTAMIAEGPDGGGVWWLAWE